MRQHISKAVIEHRRKAAVVVALLIISVGGYLGYFRFFGALPQSTIFLFQPMPSPQATDVIIVFSPHQDDETLGAGGYVTEAQARGAQVYIVYATDGNHLNLKARRQQEAYAATGILGVPRDHLIFYNYPDDHLTSHSSELDQSILATLNQLHPTTVFVTDPLDIHPDHAALGLEVTKVSKTINNPPQEYTFLIHYPKYPRPQDFRPHQYLLPPTSLIAANRQWLRFNLNGSDLDKKNEAVLQYKSQLRTPILHSLMLSFIRQNEMFSKETP